MKIKFYPAILSILMLVNTVSVSAAVTVYVNPTDSKVLTGSVRSVYSNVQGDANVTVNWSTSGGSLENHNGYTIWTAPNTPGIFTVTATSAVDGTQSATSTFTVISNAIVKVSNVPFHATIFKGQPIIIQSILWGSTDSSVTWTHSGGLLVGTGREVVFSSNVAGTYTITSTSNADNSKSSTTTIVVTDNSWPGVASANKTMPIDCTPTGSGSSYDVKSEIDMDSVPWSTLGAGDTVRIFPGTYHKQILLSTSGTESQPIRICGVRDYYGNLPEINGANATAMSGSNYGNAPWGIQGYGGITFYNSGAAYYGGASYPKNIIIEGLKISGFNSANSYYDISLGSVLTKYQQGVAPIRVQRGGNITIRGNELTDNDNGLFTMSKDGVESQNTRNLLVEGNYIHNNGKVNSYLEHQSYLQAFGLVVQGNHYGPITQGMLGGQLKTRSVQQFIRYNYFEPASRIFDLVEVQDNYILTFPWVTLDPNELINTTPSDVVANYEAYQNKFIYGNIINNVGKLTSLAILHGSADNSQSGQSGGNVYFYYNTISKSFLAGQQSNWRNSVIDFGPYSTAIDSHTVFPTALLDNNAVYIAGPSVGPVFFWNRKQADRVVLGKNWVSSLWGTGNLTGGDGTGISNSGGDLVSAVWQGGQLATQVSGISNLITGHTIPFDPSSFVPKSGGPLINASAPLTGLATTLPPLMQYSPMSHLMSVRDDINDIGALGVDCIPPVVTVTSALSPIKSSSAFLSGTLSDNIGVASVKAHLVGSLQTITATISGNSWSTTVLGLVEGSNAITVTATDTSGNTSTATATIVVDTTPPVINVFTVPATSAGLLVSGINLTATDNTGVTGYLISESATPPSAAAVNLSQPPTSYTASTSGSKTLYAWARDAAGNVSLSRSATLTIDLTFPTVTILPVTPTILTEQTIRGTVTDNIGVSSVSVQVNLANATTFTPSSEQWSYPVSNLAMGDNVITVSATDTAGNTTPESAQAKTTIKRLYAGAANTDGTITVKDAQKSLHFALGLEKPTQEQFVRSDVAPVDVITHQPAPDGNIDVDDVIIMLRRAVGLPW